MRDGGELETILSRTEAMRWINDHAASRACDVAVYGEDGTPLAGDDSLTTLTVTVTETSDDDTVSLEGFRDPSAIETVEVYDRSVGYVVAVTQNGDGTAPRAVAEQAAAMLRDLCSREFELNNMSREILAAYEELNLFYDLAGELADAPDPTAICAAVLGRAVHVIRADCGRIVLREDADLTVVASRGEDPAILPVGSGAAARVISNCEAVLLEDAEQIAASNLDAWESAAENTLITVPVYMQTEYERPALGVLQLRDRACDARAKSEPFRSGDLKLAQALASQAAVLIHNSRLIGFERELRIARRIQESLLPAELPHVVGLEVAGRCLAAKNVGGDYYDTIVRADGSLDLVLADVSGHHLAAALIQTAARATFRAALLNVDSPAAVLAHVNAALFDDLTSAELFLTAWFCHVDGVTGRVEYSDAGHHPALLYRAVHKDVIELRMGGLPVGVAEDGMYRDHAVSLAPGDTLLIYTDGLSEARGEGGPENQFGDDGVAASFLAKAHLSAEEIVQGVLDDVTTFDIGGDRDDRTLVVLKRKLEPEG